MKLKDYVLQSVYNYPSLYLCENYEESRLLVLHHIFLVLGNGMEWAHTKKPEHGGYPVHENYYKRNGDYVRKYDLPYGREKFNMVWNDLLGIGISEYLNNAFGELQGGSQDLISRDFYTKIKQERFENGIPNKKYLRSNENRKPYPICENYWLFKKLSKNNQLQYLKPDWREGMIDIKKWALDFFLNHDKYHQDDYFGSSDKSIKNYIDNIEPKLKSGEYKDWSTALKEYGIIQDIPENDYKSLTYHRSEERRLKYIKNLKEAVQVLES